MKNKLGMTKGDDEGTIDSLIKYLELQSIKGATHFKMTWSGDPMWAFKWFETYNLLSEEEVKQIKIKKLQKQIEELK